MQQEYWTVYTPDGRKYADCGWERDAIRLVEMVPGRTYRKTKYLQDQVIDVIAYRTKEAGKPIPESDYYLFTSPSNVDAFLNANEIPDRSKVVAIGPSTRSRLEELGFNPIQAKRPSLLAMVEETFNDPSET